MKDLLLQSNLKKLLYMAHTYYLLFFPFKIDDDDECLQKITCECLYQLLCVTKNGDADFHYFYSKHEVNLVNHNIPQNLIKL